MTVVPAVWLLLTTPGVVVYPPLVLTTPGVVVVYPGLVTTPVVYPALGLMTPVLVAG